jgi:hypothetical protein
MPSGGAPADAPGPAGQPDPSAGVYPPPPAYYGPYPYGPYYPYPYPPPYPPPAVTATSGWAIASLIMALLGSQVIPIIGPIVGAIFGHIALYQIGRAQGRLTGRGLAIAGIALGYTLAAIYLLTYGYLFFYGLVLPSLPSG